MSTNLMGLIGIALWLMAVGAYLRKR